MHERGHPLDVGTQATYDGNNSDVYIKEAISFVLGPEIVLTIITTVITI